MKIGIVGAGGVGACFGAHFAEAGHDVVLLCRGPHLEAIQRNGLTVEHAGERRIHRLRASDRAEDLGPCDIVLFAVKLWSTEEAAADARGFLNQRTMIITLQNGVDSVERLAPVFGEGRVAPAVAQISAAIKEPGVVVRTSQFARMAVGEPTGKPSERLAPFVAAAIAAGIEARESTNIHRELWSKFCFITALSGATCFFRSSIGPILEDMETRKFFEALVRETSALAERAGISSASELAATTLAFSKTLPGAMRASMLVDLEKGSRLEWPWLGGNVVDLSRSAGLPCPAHDAVALALRLHVDGTDRYSRGNVLAPHPHESLP